MKLFKTLGIWITVIVLILLWHRFVVSSGPPKLKAWESCKTRLLESWAAARSDKSEALHRFVQDHSYSFGATSSEDRFEDHDSRNTAVSDVGRISVSENELVQINRRIANECGAFPHR